MYLQTPNNQFEAEPSSSIMSLTTVWLLLFSVTALYCYSHGFLIRHPVTSLSHSSLWAVSVWLPWALLWPGMHRLRSSHSFLVCMIVLSVTALSGKILISLLLLPGVDVFLMIFRYLPFEVLVAWLSLLWLGRARAENECADTPSTEQPRCDGESDLPVSPELILWASAARNYVELFTNGRSYLIRTTLTELYDALRSHGFVRTHRSYMVNAEAISHLKKEGTRCYKAVLHNGASVPISMKHLSEINRLISAR